MPGEDGGSERRRRGEGQVRRERGGGEEEGEGEGEAIAAVVLESVSAPPCCPLSPSPLWLLQGHTPWPGPRNQGVKTRLRGEKRGEQEREGRISQKKEKNRADLIGKYCQAAPT